jgi:hypothetical protein
MSQQAVAADSTNHLWQRIKKVGLVALAVVLAALGGIGVALGLLQSPQ